ncbi:MAG: ANTAR domain-containing protein [Thermocrispum sp.]
MRVAPRHVCLACAADLSGAVGLSMTDGRGGLPQAVAATDEVSAELEDRQATLGEGPGVDVVNGQAALLVADLSSVEHALRWPIFTGSALARGVRAVFAFPVRAGVAGLGMLDVYRCAPGPLTEPELADALSYADAALALTLDRYGESAHPQRSVEELFTPRRAAIHQASGMVSVQLGVSLSDALAQLRAYAFSHDKHLSEVAADVVARRLRFNAAS